VKELLDRIVREADETLGKLQSGSETGSLSRCGHTSKISIARGRG